MLKPQTIPLREISNAYALSLTLTLLLTLIHALITSIKMLYLTLNFTLGLNKILAHKACQ